MAPLVELNTKNTKFDMIYHSHDCIKNGNISFKEQLMIILADLSLVFFIIIIGIPVFSTTIITGEIKIFLPLLSYSIGICLTALVVPVLLLNELLGVNYFNFCFLKTRDILLDIDQLYFYFILMFFCMISVLLNIQKKSIEKRVLKSKNCIGC